MTEYFLAQKDEDYRAAASLFNEYAAWLNIDLGFQQFNKELQDPGRVYSLAEGGIILARDQNGVFACAAIRRIGANVAELKRMYVQQAFRRQGVGKRLLKEAITLARAKGYTFIRLDTLSSMEPAIRLYTSMGFYKISPYYHNPNPEAVYLEKKVDLCH